MFLEVKFMLLGTACHISSPSILFDNIMLSGIIALDVFSLAHPFTVFAQKKFAYKCHFLLTN